VLRSTLVAGKTLLRLRTNAGQPGLPRLQWFGWDALLACHAPEGHGQLVQVADPDDIVAVTWRAMSSVYAGWDDLEEGPFSRVLAGPWPRTPPLSTVAPGFFDPVGTAVGFAATSGPGPVGCEVERVPAGRAP
jgi:hypothetical protein